MRSLLVVAAVARVASANPDRKCYEGTSTFGSQAADKLVVVREADRTKRVVRETTWNDKDPAKSSSHEFAIDPDQGTFTFELPKGRGHGTGTLEGKPWGWTAYHSRVDVPALKMQVTVDGKLAGDTLDVTTVMPWGARTETEHLVAKAFDCKDLDKHVRALEPSSADALHACYVGTDTGDGRAMEVIVDHVVDRTANALRIVRYGAGIRRDIVFHVDGDRITVTARGNPNATGTLAGKPWEWTSFSWNGNNPKVVVEVSGTLGGDHITAKQTIGKAEYALDATKFDCAKLAERRAALKEPSPVP
jgi:hypothetical protein